MRITPETRERFHRLILGIPEPVAAKSDAGLAKRALVRLRALLPGGRLAARAATTARTVAHTRLRANIAAALPPGA